MTVSPMILSDNLFSTSLYPEHVITATEETSGHEAFRVGNGRRSLSDYYTCLSTNTDMWIIAAFDRVRSFNCLIIDRGHNLAGESIDGRYWSGATAVGSPSYLGGAMTLPTYSSPGSVDNSLGVVTEEGAWVRRFSLVSGTNTALYVPAMGAGQKPSIVGIYLGLAWTPPVFDYPWSEDSGELILSDMQTDAGWMGSTRVTHRRSGVMSIRLDTPTAYDQARLHMGRFLTQRTPTWIVYDYQQAERAVCGINPGGTLGFGYEREWLNKGQAVIPWVEHEGLAA